MKSSRFAISLVITLLVLTSSSSCSHSLPFTVSLAANLSGLDLQVGLSQELDMEAKEPAHTEKIDIARATEPQEEIPAPHLQKLDATVFVYASRSGDTLPALATRFNVLPEQIQAAESLDPIGLIPAGTVLVIPKNLPADLSTSELILPDEEAVFSRSAQGFNTWAYVDRAYGYLGIYEEFVPNFWDADGWEVIDFVARNYSVNPRLLLSLLEYGSGWVHDSPKTPNQELYPLGYIDGNYQDLYSQLRFAAQQLTIGYYGWRDGTLTELVFKDSSTLRLHPELNAGTVSVMYFFSRIFDYSRWVEAMEPLSGFQAVYLSMFGNPFTRAAAYPAIFDDLTPQPEMVLPFVPGDLWFYSSGPHGAWVDQGPQTAVDFTPSTDKQRCVTADSWVLAPVTGVVTQISSGLLILDLDLDGSEQTGWVLVILHLDAVAPIKVGDLIVNDQRIGHASCLGGRATDSHIHLARKFNGEWIHASGSIPFVLDGWQVVSVGSSYEGYLFKDERVLRASITGAPDTQIRRADPNP